MSRQGSIAMEQVWRPRRGHKGPSVRVVMIHRVDRQVEVIDADSAERLRAKRRVISFRDLRRYYRREELELPRGEAA